MSRWLARLQDEEKNTKTLSDGTDKTDRTLSAEVSSVLSGRQSGEREEKTKLVEPSPSGGSREFGPIRTQHVQNEHRVPQPSGPEPHTTEARPHHLTFVPRPGPGVTIREPAIEVSAREYDSHLDAIIAVAGPGTNDARRLTHVKRTGAVVPRGLDFIFTRGRRA